MSTAKTPIEPIIWEIRGYIREMSRILHPKIIPPAIDQIVALFYHRVCIVITFGNI